MAVDYQSITELQNMMEDEQMSTKDFVLEYIKRILAVDQSGTSLNAMAELNPDAIAIAESLDRERQSKGVRGRLHGIPVVLKDNISTKDKMHTTAGSVALADNFAQKDAVVTEKLRNAGAIILGKTNMSEFAHYMALDAPDGYSSRGGQVKNPYGENFPVSGSSSGSAVAASAGLCAVAIGTETAGSITCPSMNNGLCGVKPTAELVSRDGVIPICNQDSIGPMGRTVADCSIVLDALTDEQYGYFDSLGKRPLSDFRVGVNRVRCEPGLFPTDIEGVFEDAVRELQSLGATTVDCNIPFTGLDDGILGQATMLYEFKSAMNAYLAEYSRGTCRTLHDIIQYNREHAETALVYGQDLLELAENTSGRLVEPAYWIKKIEAIEQGQAAINQAMKEKNLDVIICAGYSNLPAITGYPVVTIPIGFSSNGLPLGMSIYGGAFDEKTLLQFAYGYEQKTFHRRNPL